MVIPIPIGKESDSRIFSCRPIIISTIAAIEKEKENKSFSSKTE
jgi:hypothetical protein